MAVAALVDSGVDARQVASELAKLPLQGYQARFVRDRRASIAGTRFEVTVSPDERRAHRNLADLCAIVGGRGLPGAVEDRAVRMFRRICEVEAAVHAEPVEKVHLHEVGALDSIIDIVGAVFALEWFAADQVIVSPMNVGGGMVHSAHGVFPVPAPATLRVLGDAPVYSSGLPFELLTPTGALVLTEYATGYGPVPAMRVERIGYGAGDRDLADTPNVLRVVFGTAAAAVDVAPVLRVTVWACEIDDMNPQIFGALMDRLYDAGALDVFYQPVQMKKNRPGTLMTVVCRPDDRRTLADLVFRETTTIGVRYHEMDRECLDRETVPVTTPWGEVRVKVARRGDDVLNAQPEFDDVARLAAGHGVPIKDVHAQATKAWLDKKS
jgi:uncharacterized protein (TIGR00299 family) protein